MRLMRPDPGELADRQSILEIKIDHLDIEFDEDTNVQATKNKSSVIVARSVIANKNKVNPHPFLDELDLVQKKLKSSYILDIVNDEQKVAEYDKLYDELTNTNYALWDLEDQARILRDAPERLEDNLDYLKRCRDTLFSINDANDKRASLVKQINALWGLNTQVKLHK